MTERTTPITVHLTDEQMDTIERWDYDPTARVIRDAIQAQRPRPLKVHDVVCHRDNNGWTMEVLGMFADKAWIKHSNHLHPYEQDLASIQNCLREGIWVNLGNKATS